MPEDDFFKGRGLARSKAERFVKAPPAPAPAPASIPPPEAEGRMVDVGDKPVVPREAVASGKLHLQPATLRALADRTNPKGDPFPVARVAGILAAKRTPDIIPLCHQIPLTSVEVDLVAEADGVRARATVRTNAQTGVEMEALAAVTAALLTVWDMTKALEKDAQGQYPATAIREIRVEAKRKGTPP